MNSTLLRRVLDALMLVVPKTRKMQFILAAGAIVVGVGISYLPDSVQQKLSEVTDTVISVFVPNP